MLGALTVKTSGRREGEYAPATQPLSTAKPQDIALGF
jgi:hypothetical protein